MAAGFGPGRAAAAPVTVTGLTVDHMSDPEASDDPAPSFGWQLQSSGRGVVQTAYEVEVAESAAALAGGADVWDSGRVESSESVETRYAGPALGAKQRYFWRVRVWDGSGVASEWSEPDSWETGLRSEGFWSGAQWIAPKVATDASEWSDYRIDVGFTIDSGAAGVVFRECDQDDYYLWQIDTAGGEVVLRPQLQRAGERQVLDEIPLDEVISADEADEQHQLTIVADERTITTSIDGQQVDERELSAFAAGAIGFASGSTGDARFSGLEVHDLGGQPLFNDDFASAEDPALPGAEIGGSALRVRGSALDLIATTPTSPMLRKPFSLSRPLGQIASAHLYAYGLGLYEMRLSGSKVGDRVLTPPVTNYRNRLDYQAYGVAGQLREGENVLGMTLAEGYGAAFSPSGQRWLGPRQARVLLEIHYRDGTVQRVVSDESWRWSAGPVTSATIYDGETEDARRAQAGWDSPGFNQSGWSEVRTVAAPGGAMEADPTPPIRILRSLQPRALTEPEPGVYVFDLGQNIAGWARLQATGPAGTAIQMRYAEDLLPDGHVDTATNGNALATDTFILGGTGSPESFEPSFTYHGFRYVEVTGLPAPPTASTLVGRMVHADLPETASFESSDPLLNAIFAANQRTMANNAMSYPTDNPVRDERTGPGMDVQAYGDAAVSEFGADRFFDAYLGESGGQVAGSPDMHAAVVPIAWDLYREYGDRAALERFYPDMVASLDEYQAAVPGLVWPESNQELSNGFGDWCPPVHGDEAAAGLGGPQVGGYLWCFDEVSLVNTALAYRNAEITAAAARALGNDADADRFDDLASQIEAAFESAFADGNGYGSGRQVTSVLPLAFGMVPSDRKAAVAAGLVGRVLGADEGHLDTGIFGTRFLVDALVAAGRPDVALSVLNQTTYPGFGYELGAGATTVWEEWTYASSMESHNHAMFAGVNASLLDRFAGIESTGPGYATIRIAPQAPAGLERASASIDTVRGEVASAWKRTDSVFTLNVTVPANGTAEVAIPTQAGDEVLESGRPAANAEGVTFSRAEGSTAVYEVGSGTYHFVAAAPGFEEEEGSDEEGGSEEGGSEGEAPGEESPGGGDEGGGSEGGGSETGGGEKGGADKSVVGSSGPVVTDAAPKAAPSPSPLTSPTLPRFRATVDRGAGGRVKLLLVCEAGCPAGKPKLRVVVAGPSGRPVYAVVKQPLSGGRLVVPIGKRRLPAKLRVTVYGLASGRKVLYTGPASSGGTTLG